MTAKLSALGLTLNDVVPARRSRKGKSSLRVKYRSPDGETWSGRGHVPLLTPACSQSAYPSSLQENLEAQGRTVRSFPQG